MTMPGTKRRHPSTEAGAGAWLRGAVLLAGILAPAPMWGQALDGDPLVTDRSRMLARGVAVGTSFLPSHERYVVVHLAENRLFVMEEERAIWSAPVGTGTGFDLNGAGQKWHFSTPRGIMKVRYKEKDPVWIAPDWHFVERGVPVPRGSIRPARSPERWAPPRSIWVTGLRSTAPTGRSWCSTPIRSGGASPTDAFA